MTIRDTLEHNQQSITKRVRAGESASSISKDYNCNPGTLWYFLDSIGESTKISRTNKYGNSEKYKEQVVSLFNNNMSAYKISEQLGIPKPTVLRWLKKWGFDTSKKRTRDSSKPMLKDRYDEVRELHSQGLSQQEIANQLGYVQAQICTAMQNIGLESHDLHIKHSVNEDYFRKIDTEGKAYVLGWMYSDGNVMPDGLMRISIAEKDREILDWIKEEMDFTGEITSVKSKENDPTRQNQVLLAISRKCLVDQLAPLGCFPNKSMKLQFPTSNQVPDHLIHHFVRGYFDGDGCFSERYANIVGTLRFIYALADRLPCSITGIYQRYKDRHPEDSSHQLFICRKAEMVKFGKWLYKDSTIALKRKQDKFRCIIEQETCM